jgi:hypothetical protein
MWLFTNRKTRWNTVRMYISNVRDSRGGVGDGARGVVLRVQVALLRGVDENDEPVTSGNTVSQRGTFSRVPMSKKRPW